MRIKQAESKLNCLDPEPDLDNANVGTYKTHDAADIRLVYLQFFYAGYPLGEKGGKEHVRNLYG